MKGMSSKSLHHQKKYRMNLMKNILKDSMRLGNNLRLVNIRNALAKLEKSESKLTSKHK